MAFGISITNLMYVNSKSDDLGHLDLSTEQQIQKRPKQLETSSTSTDPSVPASIQGAQPKPPQRHEGSTGLQQTPGEMTHKSPPPEKDMSL